MYAYTCMHMFEWHEIHTQWSFEGLTLSSTLSITRIFIYSHIHLYGFWDLYGYKQEIIICHLVFRKLHEPEIICSICLWHASHWFSPPAWLFSLLAGASCQRSLGAHPNIFNTCSRAEDVYYSRARQWWYRWDHLGFCCLRLLGYSGSCSSVQGHLLDWSCLPL